MKKYLIFIIAAVILAAGGCGILKENVGESVAEEVILSQFEEMKSGEEIAVLTTDLGVIKIRFFESDAPMAVADFKGLAREGYYDGTKISRITEYYIQTGAAG
ncbi:MAG: peptidylprolyl isomerase, partial [Oscillospiraceae bacterium]|nr:peptidylprolyl isomerase [Oscillospiraceae bacterium]